MRSVIFSVWPLLFGIALMTLGYGLQSSLIGLRASLEGISTELTGLIMSGYPVGYLLGSKVAPYLVKRVGHVRVFAALASTASITILFHSLFIEVISWFSMRAATGFCYAGLYIVTESWLNSSSNNKNRGQLLSIYMLVVLCTTALGQLLLNTANPRGFELFILASVLISFALVPILLTTYSAPTIDESDDDIELRSLYNLAPLGLIGCFICGISYSGLLGLGAIYAVEIGLDISQTSLFMGATFAGAVVLQFPLGWISDQIDRRRVILFATFAAGCSSLILAIISSAHSVLYFIFILSSIFGGLSLSMYSLCVTHTNDYLESSQRVSASSKLVMITGIGGVLGPSVGSVIMGQIGASGLFWYLGSLHLVLGIFAIYILNIAPASTVSDQHSDPVPVLSGTSIVATANALEDSGYDE